MNALPLIRTHIKRAVRIHQAQLIATSNGGKFRNHSTLMLILLQERRRLCRLQNAKLMAF